MSSCLNNIVGLRDIRYPNDSIVSGSGYDLMDAPEIDIAALQHTTNEDYKAGMAHAIVTLMNAIGVVKDDFMALLVANNALSQLSNTLTDTATFAPEHVKTADYKERGFIYTRNNQRGSKLKVLKVKTIKIYPLQNAVNARINILDGSTNTYWDLDLIGGQLNQLPVDYTVQSNTIRVTMTNAVIDMASSRLSCSCNGSLPSGFGTIEGWDAGTAIRNEGFGLAVAMQYECDYDLLMCTLAKEFLAEIVWLQARLLMRDEYRHTNNFNGWIAYTKTDAGAIKEQLAEAYTSRWNHFTVSLPQLLLTHKDECITCTKLR